MSPYTSNEAKPTPLMITGESVRLQKDQEKWPERHEPGMRQKSQRGVGVKPACQALGSLVASGRPTQIASFEWDRMAKVPGPHWVLGCLSPEHWGRKGQQDSGGTECLEQLYTSTVPTETLLRISNAPACSRIPTYQPKNPSVGYISWRTGTENGQAVAGSWTHSALFLQFLQPWG